MSLDTTSVWGMWANTGNVDPVLARMLHMLRHHWGSAIDDVGALAALDAVVAGTNGDNALSRRRALFVIDRGLRRDLPRLLRAAPHAEGTATFAAADRLEQLAPLESARAAGSAIHLTFDLERRIDGVDQRVIGVAWEAARHAEGALLQDRLFQLGTAAVYICRMFAVHRNDLTGLGSHWQPARDLARDLAITLVHEAAQQR